MFFSPHTHRKCFTIIELLLVLTILSLLLAFLVPQYATITNRVRLTQAVDRFTSLFDEARTKAKSGFKKSVEGPVLSIGIHLSKQQHRFILEGYSIIEKPFLLPPPEPITTIETNDVFIQRIVAIPLTENQEDVVEEEHILEDAIILFTPPFGVASIINTADPTMLYQKIIIEIGLGPVSSTLTKKIIFSPTTNTIEYGS